MPDLSGYDLCLIFRRNSEMKNVPIIILSGLEQDSTASENCLDDAYLLETSNPSNELANKLTELFDKNSRA
jgi:DNA-binding response OmpR family regulator